MVPRARPLELAQHMGAGMTIVRVTGWGLSITEARYYGYRWGAHVGPWLVFFGQAEGRG